MKTLGADYAVSSVIIKPTAPIKSVDDYIKLIAALTQDDFKKMAGELNTLATQAKSMGLQFAYHNHNMEFRKWPERSTTYDVLMAETESLSREDRNRLWLGRPGCHPPVELFKKLPRTRPHASHQGLRPRRPSGLHGRPKNGPEGTEARQRPHRLPPILAAAPAAGVEHIFVEQEPPFTKFTALEAAKVDYDYLQSIA